jgi:hypothetical protein
LHEGPTGLMAPRYGEMNRTRVTMSMGAAHGMLAARVTLVRGIQTKMEAPQEASERGRRWGATGPKVHV